MKRVLRQFELYERLRLWAGRYRAQKEARRLPRETAVLVHIGKCGGKTILRGLEQATTNKNVHIVHVRKPPFRSDLRYIILARDPISRAQSAFRWRKRLVVEEGSQRHKFPDEYEILSKYDQLNKLAEKLYHPDGSPNRLAQRELRRIHHLREDIAFYLEELLERCRPEQITAVLMQENLNQDIARVFNYQNQLRQHQNPAGAQEEPLSALGRTNLRKFLVKDYEALTKLYKWGHLDPALFAEIMGERKGA